MQCKKYYGSDPPRAANSCYHQRRVRPDKQVVIFNSAVLRTMHSDAVVG